MAKQDITVQFTIALDEEELGKPLNIWLYQFLNRLGYEHEIKDVVVNGESGEVKNSEDLKHMPLKSRMMHRKTR